MADVYETVMKEAGPVVQTAESGEEFNAGADSRSVKAESRRMDEQSIGRNVRDFLGFVPKYARRSPRHSQE